MIRVACTKCQSLCLVEERHIGTPVRCSRCGEAFAARPAETRSARVSDPADSPDRQVSAPPDGGLRPEAPVCDWPDRQPSATDNKHVFTEEKPRPLSLERVPWALVDRLMPARPKQFLLAVALIALATWAVGWLLAPNKWEFLLSEEWQTQPFFLAAHFVSLRLFVTCYTRNFLAAAAHTTMPEGEAEERIKRILRFRGAAIAVLLAVPLCVRDAFYLHGDEYAAMAEYAYGDIGAIGWFLWLIWCVEWLLNTYIWVLLAGFCLHTLLTLRLYKFRASVEFVLHEKHYRPFLMMSAQGATVVLIFGVINAFYVWYAEGDLSDYVGLGITAGLLLLGFTPPWLQLKYNVEQEVDAEKARLQDKLVRSMRRRLEPDAGQGPATIQDLSERLDDALAILHTGYLERMHAELGRAEGRAILMRLLVPATTAAWTFVRPLLTGF
jgi:hypothetical protein